MQDQKDRHNIIEFILETLDSKDHSHLQNIDTALLFSEVGKELENFLDQIPGGFFIYRADGNEELLYSNKAMYRIFGCDTAEQFKALTNNSFKGIVYPDDLDAVENSIKKQIAESQYDLDYVIYRIKRKDGKIRWIEDYGHFHHNNHWGDIFYVFINDSTEKIETNTAERERLLRQTYEKEKKLENLIEEYDAERRIINREHLRRLEVIKALSANYESILYADLSRNEVVPYRVSIRTEKQFDSQLNAEKYSKFVTDYIKTWVHPDDRKKVKENLEAKNIVQKLGKTSTFYLDYRCIYYGELQQLQLRVANVGKDFSQIVIGFRNITDEIRNAAQQKQVLEDALENAKHAANVKNIFLSNMSHNMRTPLNAILGYTRLAASNLENTNVVKDYLDKIEIAGGHILELIEKVLNISDIRSQNYAVTETECNVSDIVGEVCKTLQVKAIRKEIKLVQNTAGIKCGNVLADEEKLKVVLWQLIDNAIKYTKNGGSVKVDAVETGTSLKGYTRFRFSVTDTGMGIDANALDRIFEPFEREYNSAVSGELGTGLGLAIAKNFAEIMDGNIEVESTVGVGSTFTFTIAFRMQNKPDKADAHTLLSALQGKKILIVDDNEINLEIESELLEEIGFATDYAENGQIALDKLQENPEDFYALILMDIQMPIMDGWKATEIIRSLENPTLANIPIIAMSANSFESDKRASLKAGMNAHIAKPMDVAELLETMSAIFTERKNN